MRDHQAMQLVERRYDKPKLILDKNVQRLRGTGTVPVPSKKLLAPHGLHFAESHRILEYIQ
jgi:hypothetical protein